MVGAEDDKLIQAEVVQSAPHATSVEMDEVREEEAPGETEERAPQPPLAGIAPGLPLAPVATEEPNPLDAFTGASPPSLRARTVIKQLNQVAIEKMAAQDYPGAVDALRRILNLTPDSPPAHRNLPPAPW